MNCRIAYLFFIFSFSVITMPAQVSRNQTLLFKPVFGNIPLQLNHFIYRAGIADSIKIITLRFYISAIELLNNNGKVWKEKNSFHLVDAADEKSFKISLDVAANTGFDQLQFNIGIDSVTNVSGAMGGDLDPTRGMYWTWQSGYINCKLEGIASQGKTRNKEFQFHLGGYQYPYRAVQKILLDIHQKEKTIIEMDIEKLIDSIDLSVQNHIMLPGKDALELSEKISKIVSIQQ